MTRHRASVHRVVVRQTLQLAGASSYPKMLRYGIPLVLVLGLFPILIAVIVASVLSSVRIKAAAVCGPPVAPPNGRSDTALVADTRVPAGGALRPGRIAQYAAGAGFGGNDLAVAVAVALAESGGRPDIDNAGLNSNGSVDYGLWQINSVHTASGFDPSRASDPTYNAAWARRVFMNAGGSWTPWVTFNNGAYQRHLAVAREAVAGGSPRAGERLAETARRNGAADVPLDDPVACDTQRGGETIVQLVRTAGSTGPITQAELDDIRAAIGQPVPSYSVLRDAAAYGDGGGGPSVNMLAPQMKVAVARLELLIGSRLMVVSGYRTAAYQAVLCTRVSGPCADAGRSMHQQGLAVDVANWTQAVPYLSEVGLCQPLPSTDAGHLSHVDGREC